MSQFITPQMLLSGETTFEAAHRIDLIRTERRRLRSGLDKLAIVAASSAHTTIRRIEFMIVVLAVVNECARPMGTAHQKMYAPACRAAVRTC